MSETEGAGDALLFSIITYSTSRPIATLNKLRLLLMLPASENLCDRDYDADKNWEGRH